MMNVIYYYFIFFEPEKANEINISNLKIIPELRIKVTRMTTILCYTSLPKILF